MGEVKYFFKNRALFVCQFYFINLLVELEAKKKKKNKQEPSN